MTRREVKRDEPVGVLAEHTAGPGTYAAGEEIRAYFDGTLRIDERGVCTVTRPRKALPNARRRKGEAPPEDQEAEATARTSIRGEGHRHGGGKHGRPRGKPKKGRGDQGAWD